MSLYYNQQNIKLAKNLRKNLTRQEKHLWYDFLRKYEIRFQRQKCIDNFIADFYCHEARLVIEIDGSQHYTPKGIRKDEFRTERLEEYDLHVIRFTNEQVDKRFFDVCEYIDMVVDTLLNVPPRRSRKASLREGGVSPRLTEGANAPEKPIT